MAQDYLKLPVLSEQEVQRFWSKVQKGAPDECWPWLAGKDWDGYGCFVVTHSGNKFQLRAHRIAYFLHYKEDPWPLLVRHLICDNPPCCNGAHLARGTIDDNNQDSVRKGRRATGVKNGRYTHPESVKRGDDVPWAKLTEPEVRAMRRLHDEGWKPFQILQFFPHVDKSNVYYVLARKSWTHI
jgi:hypothetical protein